MLEPPAKPVLESVSPDPAVDAAGFCRFVGSLFERDPDFARSDERYESAAAAVLRAAIGPLFPPAP